MEEWKRVSDKVPIPNVECPFCRGKMRLRRRSLNKSVLPSGVVYYAMDIIMKCTNKDCRYVATFGKEITMEDYEKILEEWGYRIDEHGMEEEEIKRRLKDLGYFVE